jgi:hypothetical protein
MAQRWSARAVVRRTLVVGCAAAALGLGAHAAPAAAAPAILGQWRFDEGAGQVAVDDGPHGLDARLGLTDAPDAADPVRIGGASSGALRFEGAASVSLPASDALAVQRLSAETVVRAPASPGQYRYLISRGSHGCIAGSYGLYTAVAGGIAFYVFDGAHYVVSATARPDDIWDGAWHHVAGTFDGRGLRLFIDGRAVGEPMAAPAHIDYAQTAARTFLGQYAGGCELGFHGDIDLVRLWSEALSPRAVAAAAAGSSVPTPPAGPLPAAAPGRLIPADGTAPSAPRPAAPACVVRLVRGAATATRRTVVRVRVTVRHRPLRATRVVARMRGRKAVLGRGRTNARGRARLVLSAGRHRRVRVSTLGRARCSSVLRLPRR